MQKQGIEVIVPFAFLANLGHYDFLVECLPQ